ncbi:CAF17-like 4Fe-4S cluster assembly/insertion protein YgfZ [Coxiella endosymbiont of Dermacentor marginatus]|uniref:CAF17-like 4Fe-4S cluster assembly/insertion protein YgfZ n=1 Tax=Coxiella endosymbiont of Dermacentor marginatus TaxID=1656159 RepID=UPI002221AAA8|nr:folate-binding protein [Coxiella endosymbiont of Dermacentor marginatus]
MNSTTFLQGQITCDVYKITGTQGSLSACCDHKGRTIANFYIFRQESNYYFLLPKSMVPSTLNHLKKYAVFSKVELAAVTDLMSIKPPHDINMTEIKENAWRTLNIDIGLVWIYPQTTASLIPQMINLQQWGAISFTKGCYIGQEIIARTHYLGKLKRHLYRANVICQILPAPGDKLKNQNNQNVGVIVEVASKENKEYKLLIVIQDTAADNNILFNQVTLTNITVVSEKLES